MIEEIRNLNSSLFDWYMTLEDRYKYTNPYLFYPDLKYANAAKRILVLGKETNGWGEAEGCKSVKSLENLYEDKILNQNIWSEGSPFWKFYFDWVKPSIEESDPNIGVCVTNIALLGYKYGRQGYNTVYAHVLSDFLRQYLIQLKPDAIICLAGFGTSSRKESDYLQILEPIFGKYSLPGDILLDAGKPYKWPLRKLNFSSSTFLYGTRHPQFTSGNWKGCICRSIARYVVSSI